MQPSTHGPLLFASWRQLSCGLLRTKSTWSIQLVLHVVWE